MQQTKCAAWQNSKRLWKTGHSGPGLSGLVTGRPWGSGLSWMGGTKLPSGGCSYPQDRDIPWDCLMRRSKAPSPIKQFPESRRFEYWLGGPRASRHTRLRVIIHSEVGTRLRVQHLNSASNKQTLLFHLSKSPDVGRQACALVRNVKLMRYCDDQQQK